jgi:hypothetical protein
MIDPSCLVSDWDGYGAHAIRERSIRSLYFAGLW